jgi:hypothetical protein
MEFCGLALSCTTGAGGTLGDGGGTVGVGFCKASGGMAVASVRVSAVPV